MYREHAGAIQAWVREEPAARLADVGAFVQATIQQPLDRAVKDTRSILRGDLRSLWGFKRGAIAELAEAAPALCRLYESGADRDTLLVEASRVHGFGLPKAGFLLQCAFGVSACLDTHNLTRFGVNPGAFRFRVNASDALRLKKARAYHAAVDECGGTEGLWNSWCEYVAARQSSKYRDAEHVSGLHCVALGIAA